MSEQNLVFPVATECKGKASIDEDGYRRVPHELRDQGFCAYVTRKADEQPSDRWGLALPENRSGKIMRCILRKIAEDDCANLGDISTFANPAVVDGLVRERYVAT